MPEIPDFVTIFGSAPSSTLSDQVRSYPRRLGGINFQSWCARARTVKSPSLGPGPGPRITRR